MTPRTLLLTAAAATVMAAAPTAPAQAAGNPCRTASKASTSNILASTKQSVVFTNTKRNVDYACTYRDKWLVKLSYVCCQLERYALGSRYLGYAYRLDEAFNEVDELGVVDLRTGKRLKYEKTSAASTVDTFGFVSTFFVNGKGVLAWVQSFQGDDVNPNPTDVAVFTQAAGGTLKELDRGPNVAGGSLALSSSGKTLYWTNGGVLKSAAL